MSSFSTVLNCPEVMFQIMLYLSPQDLCSFSRVNSQCFTLFSDKYFWSLKAQQDLNIEAKYFLPANWNSSSPSGLRRYCQLSAFLKMFKMSYPSNAKGAEQALYNAVLLNDDALIFYYLRNVSTVPFSILEEIIRFCRLDLLHYLFSSGHLSQHPREELFSRLFTYSSRAGFSEIIDYLSTLDFSNPLQYSNNILVGASAGNSLLLVLRALSVFMNKYPHSQIKPDLPEALDEAIIHNHPHMIEFLLNFISRTSFYSLEEIRLYIRNTLDSFDLLIGRRLLPSRCSYWKTFNVLLKFDPTLSQVIEDLRILAMTSGYFNFLKPENTQSE